VYEAAGKALRERRAGIVERWLTAYSRSLLRVPRPVDLRELSGTANAIAEELAGAFGEPNCVPGGAPLRDAEKRVAFAGGSLGMIGAGAFDVAAFVLALRDVLAAETPPGEPGESERAALATLFDWFVALAAEGYTTSREDALRMRHRDALERGTPVVMITPELPAALLVGEPDRVVLEGAFGRLLLAVVRSGAKAVIIDAAGLIRAHDPTVLDALGAFTQHRKVAGHLQLFFVNVPTEAEDAWREAADPAKPIFTERFDDAVTEAKRRS
jgi:hypothetical protein